MDSLTKPMQRLIRDFNAASVATVNDDGTPSVSPKATFVIIDGRCIAFGDIRSPGTVSNLQQRPAIELNFIDVLSRQAVRIKGSARLVDKNSVEGTSLMPMFEKLWEPYIGDMNLFVCVDIENASLVMSPAYDMGFKREDLVATNMSKLKQIASQ